MYKGLILAAAFAGTMLAGCVTMTEKIEPSLLTEATADQNAQIDKLGKDAIVKREDRVAAEKAVNIAEAMIAVSKEQIRTYEQVGKLYAAQNNLYTVEGSKDKIDAVAKSIDANNKKTAQEKANNDYLNIWCDQLVCEKELRELELASIFAQVDLIKATAAHDFQVKRQEKKPIDVSAYQKNADEIAKKIVTKQSDLKKSVEKTARAKEARDKTGYGA